MGVNNLNKHIKIKALKFPDIPHYEWEGEILEKTEHYLLVLCKSGRELIHHTKNEVYIINTTSIEYFPLKKWYTAAMEIEEGTGALISAYCNIAMPSVLNQNEISFIDLDLDFIKRKNEDWEVVDEDEFEINSMKFQYPEELKNEALKALEKLKQDVANSIFPFNYKFISGFREKGYVESSE